MGPGQMDVVTDRLSGRAPVASDRPAYDRLLRAPQVERWLRPAPLPPFSDGSVAELLRRDIEHWDRHGFGPWTMLERATDTFVGRAGLVRATLDGVDIVEIAWALVPDRWGRGYATEAARAAIDRARALGLTDVIARTLPSNDSSWRVMEKCGMTPAGEVVHADLRHVLYRLAL